MRIPDRPHKQNRRNEWSAMEGANWAGIAAVSLLYAVFLTVGWRASRRIKVGSASELLVAGRAMPFWMATITMAATWIDGGYLLGTAEGALTSIASGWQGGMCFGLSLVLGGFFFARKMRALEFVTLVDPLTIRFGRHWAAVLSVPALLGEIFWSAELLVAIGATFGVMLGLNLTTAILVSASVVTLYTLWGGMWSVGYTDSVQFLLIPFGLLIALPLALRAAGGWESVWSSYSSAHGSAALWFPPAKSDGFWTAPRIVGWWDLSIMLMLGGIPWNCYFQRIQACETPVKAKWHSITAGLITMALTIPPLLLGVVAFAYPHWVGSARQQLAASPSMALPLLFQYALPPLVGILGLTAIVGAVTSSFSASILSAGSMISWNFFRAIARPDVSVAGMRRFIRTSIFLLGALAAILALEVQSVQRLWFFTSDLVFVLLFPQLVYALYDPRANRTGSIAAFAVALVLRLGGGEPILRVPPFIPYAEWFAPWLPGGSAAWMDESGTATLFPVRIFAAASGLVLMPIISRLTASWDPPRAIPLPSSPTS
jgi:high affinity choline transporter 7